MTAQIAAAIDGYSWTAQDQASLELVLANTGSVSELVRSIDGSLAYDTLVAAGQRVWGHGGQTARLLEGEVREVRVLAIGGLRGPDGIGSPTREDGRQWLRSREVGRFGPKHIGTWVF